MGDGTSQWSDCDVRMAQERDLNLLGKCIERRSQLEKILFTYNNFHNLHPRFKDLAARAFFDEDPLLLWNFENETLLNSPEIERLMSVQSASTLPRPTGPQYLMSHPQVQHNNNAFNLVSSIDASYQQVQQPMPQYQMKGVPQGHFPPQYMTPPPDNPQRMAPAQHGNQQMMARPPPQQIMPQQQITAQQQQFPVPMMMHPPQSLPQLPVSHQMTCPPQQTQQQQMIISTAPFPPHQTVPQHQTAPQHRAPPMMAPHPQHVHPGMAPHPQHVQSGMAPPPQFQPIMMRPQPLMQQAIIPPGQPQRPMMMPPPQHQQQIVKAPPQNFQQPTMQAPPTAPHTKVQPSRNVQQQPSSKAPTSSGYSSTRESPQYGTTENQSFTAPRIVYDASGKAYKQMVVTQKVLVPVGRNTTNTSSGCSTYSRMSETGDDVQSKTGESSSRAVSMVGTNDDDDVAYEPHQEEFEDDDQTDSCTCDMSDERSTGCERHSVEMSQKTKSTSSDFVFEYTSPENRTPMASRLTEISSIESESIRVGSASSVETPEPDGDVTITAPSVYVAAPIQKKSQENEWKVVNNHRKGVELAQQMMNQCNIRSVPKPPKTPVVKVVQEENTSDIVEDVPEVEVKAKLTKKEKKLLAEAKAKDLETDDAILEAAFKERQEHEALSGNIVTSTTPVKADKKKRRGKQKVIVTSETVSGPQLSNLPPDILHRVKCAVTKRAKELEEQGWTVHPECTPIQQEYLNNVLDFNKENENIDREEVLNKVKLFLKNRIDFFREKNDKMVYSRITIYEMIFIDVPKPFLPDLLSLNVLYEKTDAKFVSYEEAFFSLF